MKTLFDFSIQNENSRFRQLLNSNYIKLDMLNSEISDYKQLVIKLKNKLKKAVLLASQYEESILTHDCKLDLQHF